MIALDQLRKWLDGEELGAEESRRIKEAIREDDPQIRAWLEESQQELGPISREELPELTEAEKGLLKKLSRCRIFTITVAGTMPPEWFRRSVETPGPISGTVRGWVSGEARDFPMEMTRTGNAPPTVELRIPQWPPDLEPVCLTLAELNLVQRKPVSELAYLGKAPLSLAAKSTVHAPREADLELKLGEGLTVHVWGKVPQDRSNDYVVAECLIEDGVGGQDRQTRVVELFGGSGGGKKRRLASFTPPKEWLTATAQVTIRSLAEEDLWILDPVAATDTLARAKRHLTMSLKRTGEVFTFSARWPDQQEMAGDPTASWFLYVAHPE